MLVPNQDIFSKVTQLAATAIALKTKSNYKRVLDRFATFLRKVLIQYRLLKWKLDHFSFGRNLPLTLWKVTSMQLNAFGIMVASLLGKFLLWLK